MIETSTIIEAIHYLLGKIGPAKITKIIKLVYLTDKYHLIHYGRTVTNDEYFAMPLGPVGSTVKDVLSFNDFTLSPEEYKYSHKLFEKTVEDEFKALDAKVVHEMLSDTDVEALDFVIDKFSHMSSKELVNYTHKYPEWYQYKDLLEDGKTRRERLDTKELLSLIEDDPLALPEIHVKESENILTGNYQ